MSTRDNAESIVQDLHDMACEGDITEVMVFARDASGRLLCAYASDDMQRFIDDVRAALADAEANPSPRRTLQ